MRSAAPLPLAPSTHCDHERADTARVTVYCGSELGAGLPSGALPSGRVRAGAVDDSVRGLLDAHWHAPLADSGSVSRPPTPSSLIALPPSLLIPSYYSGQPRVIRLGVPFGIFSQMLPQSVHMTDSTLWNLGWDCERASHRLSLLSMHATASSLTLPLM